MKKLLKFLGTIVLMMVIGSSLVGCGDDSGSVGSSPNVPSPGPSSSYTFYFNNLSYQNVHISCPDLNPNEFDVPAASSRTATSSLSSVQVIYSPYYGIDASYDASSRTFTFK